VLKEIHKEMSLEAVEKLIEETDEARAYQREVSNLLAGVMTNEEEDAVEDELEALEREVSIAIVIILPRVWQIFDFPPLRRSSVRERYLPCPMPRAWSQYPQRCERRRRRRKTAKRKWRRKLDERRSGQRLGERRRERGWNRFWHKNWSFFFFALFSLSALIRRLGIHVVRYGGLLFFNFQSKYQDPEMS